MLFMDLGKVSKILVCVFETFKILIICHFMKRKTDIPECLRACYEKFPKIPNLKFLYLSLL